MGRSIESMDSLQNCLRKTLVIQEKKVFGYLGKVQCPVEIKMKREITKIGMK